MTDLEEKNTAPLRRIIRTLIIAIVTIVVIYGIVYFAFSAHAHKLETADVKARETCETDRSKNDKIALKNYLDSGTYTPPAACASTLMEIQAGILGLPSYKPTKL